MENLEYSFIYLSEEDKERVDRDAKRFHQNHNLSTPLFTGKDLVVTHPFLLPLLIKVACNHPGWSFRSNGVRLGVDRKQFTAPHGIVETPELRVSQVTVHTTKGKEIIGSLGVDTSSTHPRFKLDSPSLNRNRQRGYNTCTKDIGKASRIINKSFYPLTLEERVEEMHHKLFNTLNGSVMNKEMIHNNQWRGIRQHLRPHIEENWDTFAPICVAAGLEEEIANTFLKTKHDTGVLKKLKADTTRVFVWLEGDQYFLRKGDAEVQVYTTYDLPANYKQKIGMLKMLDDEHAVTGVGYRLDANSFLIVEEEFDA